MIELPDRTIDVPRFHEVTLRDFKAHKIWVIDRPGEVTITSWSWKRKIRFFIDKVLFRNTSSVNVRIEYCMIVDTTTSAITVKNP